MQEKKIQLRSGALSYLEGGAGEPLLYLHPAGGVRRSKVLEGLAQSVHLYVPVIPGWEGTDVHPGVNSRRALGALMADFHATAIGAQCDTMGWSFGGAVALWLAVERPELVQRLVLECPAGLASIDPRIKRVNRALLEHYGAEDGKDAALVGRVGEIAQPTLILQGDNDGTIPASSAQWLHSQLRHARLVHIEGAGHDLEMDAPDRVLAEVRSFLGHPR